MTIRKQKPPGGMWLTDVSQAAFFYCFIIYRNGGSIEIKDLSLRTEGEPLSFRNEKSVLVPDNQVGFDPPVGDDEDGAAFGKVIGVFQQVHGGL